MTDKKEYGRALFLLCEEEGVTDAVFTDMKTVISAIDENPDYIKLLDTPALSADEKIKLIDKAFQGINEFLVNMIKILCEHHAVRSLCEIDKTFCELYDEKRGILRVEAITALPLTESQIDSIEKRLGEKLGKSIILKNTTDRTILGGVKLRYGGVQLDGSVKTRLVSFENSLKNIVI